MGALVRGILEAFGLAAKRAITPIEVRPGNAQEVRAVRHEVLRAGRPPETAIFDGDEKPTTRHWVAQQSDRIVGVVSVMAAVMPEGPAQAPRWQLRGMAVLPELRGAGVGQALLQTVHTDVNDRLWCNARANVEAFYSRGGWVRHGEPFDIEPIGPHVRMTWTP